MTTHLVTGATGFVGGALVLELLQRTEDDVLALIRPGDGGAQARLNAALHDAARAYGVPHLPLHRVRAVAGDVTRPRCGVEDAVRADMVWHSAASLRYEDRYADEIVATNVGGTRNVVELSRHVGATVLNAISTAYVAGSREGRIGEVPLDDSRAQNHYERSKVAAEVIAAGSGLRVRVFRPSIVVGHSRTLAATTFSGLYGFVRQMLQFRGILERMQTGLSRTRRIRMRATRDGRVDLVPVDAVAAQAVHVGLDPSSEGIYHLTHPHNPTVSDVIGGVATLLGFPEPEMIEGDADLDWIDRQLDKRMDFYGSYIRGHRVFDRSRIDAAGGDLHRPLPAVRDLAAWYLERLQSERGELPAAR